jgi:protein gp37
LAEREGVRRRVFCGSMCDVFEKRTNLEGARGRLISLIHQTPNLDWLILTKRPENIEAMWDEAATDWGEPGTLAMPLENVWLGYSASTQADLDRGSPHLLKCPAAVRFLSLEPLLEPISLSYKPGTRQHLPGRLLDEVHWVIVGGESGPGARPCNLAWIRSIVAQCKAAGVPVFVKQLGALPVIDYYTDEDDLREQCLADNGRVWEPARGGWSPWDWRQDHYQPRPGTILEMKLHDPKGGDMDEWPEDLRVRQMPGGAE